MYLYGVGGHAKVIAEILESMGKTINGLFDDNQHVKELKGMKVEKGIRVSDKNTFPVLESPVIISIGNNNERAEIADLLANSFDVKFGKAIHSTSIISPSASIAEGVMILHGSIIQAETIIGKHVLVNTAASIDHENVIGDYAHVSPHATLCGRVHVGEGTHIGAGAVVLPNIKIGKWCKIGAGAVVISDIPDFSTAVGNPARILVKSFKI
ncbi:acetyltransferase [Flavobacterium sp. ZB4P13]|uniref:acetyltransferase n=1 Tax=Flavobacterium sp. ZB4P13 TaxID=3401728 RepID=UPI003AB0EA14